MNMGLREHINKALHHPAANTLEMRPSFEKETRRSPRAACPQRHYSCPNLMEKSEEMPHKERLIRTQSTTSFDEKSPKYFNQDLLLHQPTQKEGARNYHAETTSEAAGPFGPMMQCCACPCPVPSPPAKCLPPPCNVPPQCLQYMTGYYYYPYGTWFCGPYHVRTSHGPCYGPVQPGGPNGPSVCCPSNPCRLCEPCGPCGPCGPCATCCTPLCGFVPGMTNTCAVCSSSSQYTEPMAPLAASLCSPSNCNSFRSTDEASTGTPGRHDSRSPCNDCPYCQNQIPVFRTPEQSKADKSCNPKVSMSLDGSRVVESLRSSAVSSGWVTPGITDLQSAKKKEIKTSFSAECDTAAVTGPAESSNTSSKGKLQSIPLPPSPPPKGKSGNALRSYLFNKIKSKQECRSLPPENLMLASYYSTQFSKPVPVEAFIKRIQEQEASLCVTRKPQLKKYHRKYVKLY